MTPDPVEEIARRIVQFGVHSHGRWGNPLDCVSCRKLVETIAAAFATERQRADGAIRVANLAVSIRAAEDCVSEHTTICGVCAPPEIAVCADLERLCAEVHRLADEYEAALAAWSVQTATVVAT